MVAGTSQILTLTLHGSHDRAGLLSPQGSRKTFNATTNRFAGAEAIVVINIKRALVLENKTIPPNIKLKSTIPRVRPWSLTRGLSVLANTGFPAIPFEHYKLLVPGIPQRHPSGPRSSNTRNTSGSIPNRHGIWNAQGP